MTYFLICIGIIVPVLFYRLGLRDGLSIKKNDALPVMRSPVDAIREALDPKPDEILQGITNILTYTGKKRGESE